MSLLLSGTQATSGQTIEDFEDGNITEYGGDTGSFSVQSTTVSNGNDALESGGGSPISDTGQSLSQDTNYRADVRSTATGSWVGWLFFTQSESTTPGGYVVQARIGQNDIRLSSLDGSGNLSVIGSTGAATLSTNTWYTLIFEPGSGGSITYGVASDDNGSTVTTSDSDSTYSSGGIGAYPSGTNTQQWDYLRSV